jgi:hypothetical protein
MYGVYVHVEADCLGTWIGVRVGVITGEALSMQAADPLASHEAKPPTFCGTCVAHERTGTVQVWQLGHGPQCSQGMSSLASRATACPSKS